MTTRFWNPQGDRIRLFVDDGTVTFCLPMASVIHGFIYNKEVFEVLGLAPPETEQEFFALLEKIKQAGGYTPMAMGTADQWHCTPC